MVYRQAVWTIATSATTVDARLTRFAPEHWLNRQWHTKESASLRETFNVCATQPQFQVLDGGHWKVLY